MLRIEGSGVGDVFLNLGGVHCQARNLVEKGTG